MAKWRQTELTTTARVALAAGNEKQTLPDGTAETGSAFGRALAAALRWGAKGRAADYNDDGCVDRYELAAYVSAHGKTAANSPRMGPLPNDEAGILALCWGRFDRPPEVKSWGARRGKADEVPQVEVGQFRDGFPEPWWEPGQEMAPETPQRPAMLYIPAGRFMMGSPEDEPGRDSKEVLHPVSITRPFLMMRTEVTQGQWQAVMGNNPSGFPACGATCPVENVNWYDAVSYANALSKREKLPICYTLRGCTGQAGKDLACEGGDLAPGCMGYRLPTEAE